MSSETPASRTPERLPELLAPAGSPDALEAAVVAGADAVYVGGSAFNARMNAHNFDKTELGAAVTYAHRAGTRVYLTLNTLILDRELAAALDAAYEAAVCGVDGLIIADVGAAACIHRALPSLPLHASTQLSGHHSRIGRVLAPLGFSRFVMAREATLPDLRAAVRDSGLEVEVFIHGALCVSHSGQCLFSSVVGGRSGNRGLCAQPCRLPYRCAGKGKGRDEYPLSLKDLSLARHVPELLSSGVASLKIEGRMKSAAYVGGVTAIWRRLLDEGRAATDEDMEALSELFSREGFTDGYLTDRISHGMMGVRSETDKARTAAAEKASADTAASARAALPVTAEVTVRAGEHVSLTVTAPLFRQSNPATVTCTVTGDIPDAAQNPAAALSRDTLEKQLTRTGGTPYRISALTASTDGGLILPVSRLNALRRAALEAVDAARMAAMPTPSRPYDVTVRESPAARPASSDAPASAFETVLTARFYRPEQITAEAEAAFALLWLPMLHWAPGIKRGVILPPVIFDRETDAVRTRLAAILRSGARDILVGNLGHIPLVREVLGSLGADIDPRTVTLHGDFRLNVTNAVTADRLLSLGLEDVILSPELTLPRLRDISDAHPGRTSTVIYGRLPLMLLEKCAIRELYGTPADKNAPCGSAGQACRICARDGAAMTDRRGVTFPILRELSHRNTVLNSLPLSMTDRADELAHAHISRRHFMFTVESPERVNEVILAAERGTSVGEDVRRIAK